MNNLKMAVEKSKYNNEKILIYDQCEAYIDSLPSPLVDFGRKYLHGYSKGLHAVKGWELPYWLGESFGLGVKLCRKIALSNVFGGMYVHIIDAVMDSDDKDMPNLLSIDTLFYRRSIEIYQNLFPANSEFWRYLEKYLIEWGDAILWERQSHRYIMQPFYECDLIRLARKASPIKICCAAVSLLANVPQYIEDIEKAIDYMYAAIEVTDCLIDAQVDLENECYSYVLMKIAEDMEVTSVEQFDQKLLNRAYFATNIIDFAIDKAIELSNLSISIISRIGIEGLLNYLCENIINLRKMRHNLKSKLTRQLEEVFNFNLLIPLNK